MLPMSVAWSSGMLTIGRIAYRREWQRGDGSAQRGRSVIYDCLVVYVCILCITVYCMLPVSMARSSGMSTTWWGGPGGIEA